MIARLRFVVDPDKVPSCFEVDPARIEATIREAVAKACPILAIASVEVSFSEDECEQSGCDHPAWVNGLCMTHFDEYLRDGARVGAAR